MPNHVHILIEPLNVAQAVRLCNSGSSQGKPSCQSSQPEGERCYALSQILQNLKGYTSRQANQLLGRCGAFWQDESYDHWVRDETEYARIVDYIDQNPVKAGLCAAPRQWRWSSAADVAQAVSL
jgi:putative DNA methylase